MSNYLSITMNKNIEDDWVTIICKETGNKLRVRINKANGGEASQARVLFEAEKSEFKIFRERSKNPRFKNLIKEIAKGEFGNGQN